MKNTKLLAAFLSLFLLTGCSLSHISLPTLSSITSIPFVSSILSIPLFNRDQSSAAETIDVYRVSADTESAGSDLIQTETMTIPEGYAQEIDMALSLFQSAPKDDDLLCALPTGVTVDSWTSENGVVTLSLSDSFLDAGDMEQTIGAACAALTLYQLEGVEAVTVEAGGITVFSALVPEDTLLKDTDTDPYVRQLRLYFADADGRYLISEYHSLTLAEETSPERYVVEELLRGPNSGELQSVIPTGTSLLSCSTVEGVCTVDLSAAFYINRPKTALGERLAIYSLVNSLTALSSVDSVVLLVEGRSVDTYVYRSLAEPLYHYDEIIGPVAAAKGELDADLYLALPGLTSLTAIPFRVDATDYESEAEAVVAALLYCAEPGYPSLFSGSGSISSIDVRTSDCVVDLSESFFASLDADERDIAVQSIAATICALPEIRSVRFSIGGSAAVFDGTDWSGPWYDFSEIEVQ